MPSLIDRAVEMSETLMSSQDKIWSKYSNDKVDIGEALMQVLRTLASSLPLSRAIRGLSIGSSNEPQFRILQAFCRGGLYLIDIEEEALAAVAERIERQDTENVVTIAKDYTRIFLHAEKTQSFRARTLRGRPVDLITLHHSMYYCPEQQWLPLMTNLFRTVLAPRGAIHAVLMAADSDDDTSTTWLYNHFAGKFCGHRNTQDLRAFAHKLRRDPAFARASLRVRTSRVRFQVDDFEQFMAVVWMILLYPNVHQYTLAQREEIAHHVHGHFFRRRQPLVQLQDHLVLYRGRSGRAVV